MDWPHAVELAASGAETPIVAVRVDPFSHAVAEVADRHRQARSNWRPATTWAGQPSLGGLLTGAGVASASVTTLGDVEAGLAAGLTDHLVTVPPVAEPATDRLARLASRSEVSVVCDHFVQAERIAAACRRRGAVSELLIRIDVGRQRLGVRPGPDLYDLYQGVSRLRGVRVGGLFVAGAGSGRGVPELSADALARLLHRCRTAFRSTPEGLRVSVARLEDLPSDLGPFSFAEARTPLPVGSDPNSATAAIVATVVSRPTREQAVLDLGRIQLGRSVPSALVGEPEAELTDLTDEVAVFRLPPDGRGLAIGDAVAVVTDPPPRISPETPLLLIEASGCRVSRPR